MRQRMLRWAIALVLLGFAAPAPAAWDATVVNIQGVLTDNPTVDQTR